MTHVKHNHLTVDHLKTYLRLTLLGAGLVAAALIHLLQDQAAAASVQMVPRSFHELAAAASPSVVNIRTVRTVKGNGGAFNQLPRDPEGEAPPFQEFFERYFGEEFQQEFKRRSLGSGFIIDPSGHIVTNNHVIEDADRIRVKLRNGDEYDAEIVGRDPNTDLALIKNRFGKEIPQCPPRRFGGAQSRRMGHGHRQPFRP